MNYLTKKYDASQYYFIMISFNGSNFDDYFLLQNSCKYADNCNASVF